jgi:ubiquitin conjugation factor E4 B
VWDPAKYNFTPKEWLRRIVEIYLNFGQYDTFMEAVQRDGRSFKPEAFRRIVALLKDQMIMSLVRVRARSAPFLFTFVV